MQIFFAIPNVIYPIILAGLGFILISLQVKKNRTIYYHGLGHS